jgi:hypothetical protein
MKYIRNIKKPTYETIKVYEDLKEDITIDDPTDPEKAFLLEKGKSYEVVRKSLDEAKTPYDFKTSNLIMIGEGVDNWGNRIVRLKYPNSRAFSIQTNNEGLWVTHRNQKTLINNPDKLPETTKLEIERELIKYVSKWGSTKQKDGLNVWSNYKESTSKEPIDNITTSDNFLNILTENFNHYVIVEKDSNPEKFEYNLGVAIRNLVENAMIDTAIFTDGFMNGYEDDEFYENSDTEEEYELNVYDDDYPIIDEYQPPDYDISGYTSY